ncbi:MAG: glycosyltransferase family 4 protein [Planctomycetia bacterium]
MSAPVAPDLFPSLDALETVLWSGAGLLAFAATATMADLIVITSTRWRLVDLPNRRSAHALPTARGGGLAIVVTVLLGLIATAIRFPWLTVQIVFGLLLPSLVIAVVGFIDDIRPLRPLLRLGIQIGVGCLITAALGPITGITLPASEPLQLGIFAWPVTVVWVVGMINALNFMDGSDGMAALAAAVVATIVAVIAWFTGAPAATLVAGFVAAGAAGFLVFNWTPARIFMGDVGSGFLGTLLSALPLFLPNEQREAVFLPAILVLWPYIYDPLLSVLRRLWNGKNPLQPHREFLFHRLIRSGVDHGRAAILYAALALCGGGAAFCMLDPDFPVPVRRYMPLIIIALAAALTWGTERLAARMKIDGESTSRTARPVPRPR